LSWRFSSRVAIGACLGLFSLLGVSASSRQSPPPLGPEKYWILFRDKGPVSDRTRLIEAERRLSARSHARRARHGVRVGFAELALEPRYLDELRAMGIRPLAESRWVNAMSAVLDQNEVGRVRRLPFVRAVRRVARHAALPPPERVDPLRLGWVSASGLDYGQSSSQNLLINVPAVHDLGLHGEGVLVGLLDTGFRWQEHEALVATEIVAEYDFIHGDGVTRNQPEQGDSWDQDHHGTETLAAAGGYLPGKLIGPAFGAAFALAKTEWIPDETHAEEDFWVQGIEWLEAVGADVVSSSLGYLNGFSDGGDYSPADLDGASAVTTLAAEMAARRGVVVVNSAGNGGPGPETLVTPADGPSVVAVGALHPSGALASFSSRGPSADGRVKPDVVAQGSSVTTVDPERPDAYLALAGTSFSCPQVAAVAALILQAHPRLTPLQVLEALRETADRRYRPDNDFGWGRVDALAAVLYHGPPQKAAAGGR
jgi:subtilisin family serine protease